MSNELIASVVLGGFQLLITIIIGLVGLFIKSSMANINASIGKIEESIKEEKRDRDKHDDEIFGRLRTIEKDYADRNEVKEIINSRLKENNERL